MAVTKESIDHEVDLMLADLGLDSGLFKAQDIDLAFMTLFLALHKRVVKLEEKKDG